jgi:hypothetical protein
MLRETCEGISTLIKLIANWIFFFFFVWKKKMNKLFMPSQH